MKLTDEQTAAIHLQTLDRHSFEKHRGASRLTEGLLTNCMKVTPALNGFGSDSSSAAAHMHYQQYSCAVRKRQPVTLVCFLAS
jgi:hypothetical protein